jgi:hypothetical protein
MHSALGKYDSRTIRRKRFVAPVRYASDNVH